MKSFDRRSSNSAPGTASLRRVEHQPTIVSSFASTSLSSLAHQQKHRITSKKSLIVTYLSPPAKRSLVSLLGSDDEGSVTTSASIRSTRCSSFYSVVFNRLSTSKSNKRPVSGLSRSKRYHYNLFYYQNQERLLSSVCDRPNDTLSRSSSTRSLIEHNINHNRRFLDRLRRKKDFNQLQQYLASCCTVDNKNSENKSLVADQTEPEECCRLLNSQVEEQQQEDTTSYCYDPPNPYYTHFHHLCEHNRRYSSSSYFHQHHHHCHSCQPTYQNLNFLTVKSNKTCENLSDSSNNGKEDLVSSSISSSSISTDSTVLSEQGSNCLSTIMEILPLILLLTMGVVISTTCAKSTFHESPNLSNHSRSSHHYGDASTPGGFSHYHQEHLLSMAIKNDEEYGSEFSASGNSRTSSGISEILKSNNPGQRFSHRGYSSYAGKTPQQQHLMSQLDQVRRQYSVMRLRWLSNDTVTCNDGTRAGYYIRSSPSSQRWLIYLEGGWFCMSKSSCDQRWSKMREFMTSFRWSEFKTFNGILSSSQTTNPYWWDANHVFVPYCSSDIWSGDSAPRNEMAFMGSRIIDEVIKDLFKSSQYYFNDAKLVVLAGSSAGAAGVMINLDRVAQTIADSGSKADVRGLADSGWILENDYLESKQHSKSMLPCTDSSNCSPMESIKNAFRMWNSRVPKVCVDRFPTEPWRCYFGHRLYPTLQTPLFVVQYQYDEFQVHLDGMHGRSLNEYEKMHYIRSLSEKIRSTLSNVSAVYAPSCMSHIMLTKLDWHKTTIRGVTLPEALNCWEQNPSATNHPKLTDRSYFPFSNRPRPNLYNVINSKNFYNSMSSSSGSFHKTNQPQSSEGPSDELSQFYNTRQDFNLSPQPASQNRKARHLEETIFSNPIYSNIQSSETPAELSNDSKTLEINNNVKTALNKTGSNDQSIKSNSGINENSISSVQVNPSNDTSKTAIQNNHTKLASSSPPTGEAQSNSNKINKKRKKRKRRKHHGGRRHNGTHHVPYHSKQESSTKTTVFLNEATRSGTKASRRDDDLQRRLTGMHVTGGDEFEWQDTSTSQLDEPKCDYRLIDDHSYLKRNFDCPRMYKPYMD